MTHQAPIATGQSLVFAAADLEPPAPPARQPRWTGAKMAEFLRELAATHSVSAAAQAVGMSRQSAYRLRTRLRGKAFDRAWDAALVHVFESLAHVALERAVNGVEVPVFHRGEQVGTYRKFDERLTVALLALAAQAGYMPMLGSRQYVVDERAGQFGRLLADIAASEDIHTVDV